MRSKIKMKSLIVMCMIAAGVIPMGIASFILTKDSSATMTAKTYTLLNSEVSGRKDYIESYLNTLVHQNQATSKSVMTIEAMTEFTTAYNRLPAEVSLDSKDQSNMELALRRYYRNDYARAISDENKTSTDAESLIPRTRAGKIAQRAYITDNQNAMGEKDSLLAANDGSQYDKTHEKYHGALRSY